MLTIAICEDEPAAARQLNALISHFCRQRHLDYTVSAFSSGEALLLARPEPDIVFMDIKLPGENGMTTARRLRQGGFRGALLFLTAYPRYVFGAFDLEAVHYLLKPVRAETLFPALDRAVSWVSARRAPAILLHRENQLVKTAIPDIFYCETQGRQVLVHTRAEQLVYSGTLDSLEPQLGPSFFRCHRSYLVNLDAVIGQQGELALLPGGGQALISRRKRREFGQRLLESCQKGGV